MLHYFLNLPSFLMFLTAIIISSAISIFILIRIRKHQSLESMQENHEVGGFLFNALGLIYAVLISFVVYATWSDYKSAQEYCDIEANALQDLFFNSEGLPEEYHNAVREKIVQYLETVINVDWPLLSEDKDNPGSKEILKDLWKIYLSIDTLKNDKQQIMLSGSLSKLNDVTDYRRLRILSSQNHIPAIIWTVIIIGALTSVGFSMFFGTRSLVVQASMTSLFAMTNVIILLLILSLDHPFTGDIKISPAPFEQMYDFLMPYMTM